MLVIFFLFSQAQALFYPMQVHLSWTENPSEMRVTWQSRLNGKAIISYRPIFCGNSSTWTEFEAETTRIDFGTELYRFSFVHTGVMSNISSDCHYEYSVSNGLFSSDNYVFNGRTPGQDKQTSYKMLIYGDLGTHEYGKKTFNLMKTMTETEEILGVIHMGDIAYNLDSQQGLIGDKFLNMIKPIASSHAYMTVPGNHEKANNYTAYKQRFIMPRNDANQNTSYFYSFDIGPVHYVLLNTNPYLKTSLKGERETQTNWLIQDLKKANENRINVPWIITLHHHLLYCSHDPSDSGSRKDCEVQAAVIRHSLEDIYYENKVDLVLSGHVHHYERQASVYKNQTVYGEVDELNKHVNANAPIHIISGSAGNWIRKNDPAAPNPCLWTRFMSDDFGFGTLSVLNETALLWEQFSSETNKMIDWVYIIKYQKKLDSLIS